jgi:hypothetical protein
MKEMKLFFKLGLIFLCAALVVACMAFSIMKRTYEDILSTERCRISSLNSDLKTVNSKYEALSERYNEVSRNFAVYKTQYSDNSDLIAMYEFYYGELTVPMVKDRIKELGLGYDDLWMYDLEFLFPTPTPSAKPTAKFYGDGIDNPTPVNPTTPTPTPQAYTVPRMDTLTPEPTSRPCPIVNGHVDFPTD